MTKAEAIERLIRFKAQAIEEFVGEWPEDYEALDMAIEELNKSPFNPIKDDIDVGSYWCGFTAGQRAATQWIPCSERLPASGENKYWICTDTGYQCECRWTNDRWGIGESDTWGWKPFDIPQYTKVVAWMPLPQPYAGDN